MELWIRNQDRDLLVPIKDLISEFAGSLFYQGIILGQYNNSKRALEVLDEIQNILKPKIIVKSGNPVAKTLDDVVYRTPDKVEMKELSVVIYEMPEE